MNADRTKWKRENVKKIRKNFNPNQGRRIPTYEIACEQLH